MAGPSAKRGDLWQGDFVDFHGQLYANDSSRRGRTHGSSHGQQEGIRFERHRSRAERNPETSAKPSPKMAANLAGKSQFLHESGKNRPPRFSANGRSTRRRSFAEKRG